MRGGPHVEFDFCTLKQPYNHYDMLHIRSSGICIFVFSNRLCFHAFPAPMPTHVCECTCMFQHISSEMKILRVRAHHSNSASVHAQARTPACLPACRHACRHACVQARRHACVHACMRYIYIYIYMYMYIDIHLSLSLSIYLSLSLYIYIYIYMYVCMYIHFPR